MPLISRKTVERIIDLHMLELVAKLENLYPDDKPSIDYTARVQDGGKEKLGNKFYHQKSTRD